jgi:signal transduction histidine kinase
MTSVAEEAKELLFALINEKKCKVIIQENMPEVFADKSRIREIFQNLIENAVKFSNTDEIPLVEVFSVNRNGLDIFCVRDNGIGISKVYHEKIFGLFNKLDNSSSGTGVGLSLVKHITESHKGKIWVESDGYNSGTLFCFTLNTEN